MATVFLGESIELVSEADTAISISDPEIENLKEGMNAISRALEAARFEMTLALRSTSDSDNFHRLDDFVIGVRDATLKVIRAVGDPSADTDPLTSARDLLDRVSVHIHLRDHVKWLSQQPASIGSDLEALSSSMTTLVGLFNTFASAVNTTFRKYQGLRG